MVGLHSYTKKTNKLKQKLKEIYKNIFTQFVNSILN